MVSPNPNPFLYRLLLFPGAFILPVEFGLVYSLPFHLTFYCYLFILGCAGSLLLGSFPLVVTNRDSSLVAVNAFSLQWLLLLRSIGSSRWASVAVAPGLWSTGAVVVAHGLSYRVARGILMDGACVSCSGRQIPYR